MPRASIPVFVRDAICFESRSGLFVESVVIRTQLVRSFAVMIGLRLAHLGFRSRPNLAPCCLCLVDTVPTGPNLGKTSQRCRSSCRQRPPPQSEHSSLPWRLEKHLRSCPNCSFIFCVCHAVRGSLRGRRLERRSLSEEGRCAQQQLRRVGQ